jgi:hypothetical protein
MEITRARPLWPPESAWCVRKIAASPDFVAEVPVCCCRAGYDVLPRGTKVDVSVEQKVYLSLDTKLDEGASGPINSLFAISGLNYPTR